MENSIEKIDSKKELEDKTTVKAKVSDVANKRVPRAYRITLKNNPRTKDNERKTSVHEKDAIEHSGETSAENVPENPDDSPGKRKSRFIKFQMVSEVEAENVVKEVDPKKKKSALRRKNRNIRKKAENKEILDNIVACIVLMEEKLAKCDIPERSVDANKDSVDSSAPIESVGIKTSETEGSASTSSSLPETEVMKNEKNGTKSEPVKAMDTHPEKNVVKTSDTPDREANDENQGSRKNRKGRSKKTKRNKENESLLPEEQATKPEEDLNELSTTDDKVLESKKVEAEEKDSTRQEIKPETPITPVSPQNRFRPTHFLACRVHSTDIRRKVDAIQANILNINKDYKPSLVETRYLYTTLAVLALKAEEEKEKAIKAIELSLQKVGDAYNKSSCKFVEFASLGTFKDQFLFIKMKETEGLELLQSIISIFKENMIERDVLVRQESFSPHVTIAKLRNRYSLKKKGIKKIPSSMYAEQKNDYFGKEELTEILLCSLADKKEGEFHNVIASIDLRNCNIVHPEKLASGPSNSST